VAGRIRDEDIKVVRDASRIDEIIGEHLQLRRAGGGSLKGLCPFHDEKTPSFNVRPSVGTYHCFGCGEGGDVIDFVMRVDALTFSEAVERLAARYNIQLRYAEGGYTSRGQPGQRTRLVDAHKAAAEFYVEHLASAEADVGRRFLAERGFDSAVAEAYRIGYAPRSWDALLRHLRARGFTDSELLTAGLASEGRRGPIDRFRGRLMWPIRDITGDIIGFGARKLYEEDNSPKYLNTPESPIYKKSTVLYGVDLAKKEIGRQRRAVVVEGYTDVMACHLAGVPTAIATCGTSFGEEHIKVLRRLLMDQNEFRGEVIFTFDGDEAGQKAAERAYQEDQRFLSQTFVAVDRDGMDPCDLRLTKGDAAVRELIAQRQPLFRFVIRRAVDGYDLDTAEGRTAAARAGIAEVRKIKDVSLRRDYARQLAGWVGLPDPNELVVLARGSVADVGRRAANARPDPNDPALMVERECLKFALQAPALLAPDFDTVEAGMFTAAPYAAVQAAIAAAGGTSRAGDDWVGTVRESARNDAVRSLVAELAVEPIRAELEADARYAGELLARLQELAAGRRIAEVKARLQRLNPVEQQEEYNRLFGELVALEQHRRVLREQALGSA
jgi:DNA primase